MKQIITVIALVLTVTFVGAASASAQSKVGVVDMNRAFAGYYKTKDAEAKLDAARAQATADLEARTTTLRTSMEAINTLEAESKDPAKREATLKQRDAILGKVRELDREILEIRQNRERQLQEQFLRMRGDLVQEITKIVDAQASAAGYVLVLDSSALGISQVKSVLFSAPALDFTDAVIAELNSGAPQR